LCSFPGCTQSKTLKTNRLLADPLHGFLRWVTEGVEKVPRKMHNLEYGMVEEIEFYCTITACCPTLGAGPSPGTPLGRVYFLGKTFGCKSTYLRDLSPFPRPSVHFDLNSTNVHKPDVQTERCGSEVHRTSHSPYYLVRKDRSCFCFRLIVPLDLRRFVGRTELRYSLRTGFLGVAEQKSRYVAGQARFLFNLIRKGVLRVGGLSEGRVQDLVRRYIKQSIEGWDRGLDDLGGQ
jgi:hypothetical protein